MNIDITIDPHVSLHYAAFYILGLNNCFPGKIKFSHDPFKHVREGRSTCLLFILKIDNVVYKMAIDFHDANSINYSVLKWADTYAKINYHTIETIEDLKNNIIDEIEFLNDKAKLVAIPPSFGVNIYEPLEFFRFFGKISMNKKLNLVTKKTILLDALRMVIKRRPLKDYYPNNSNRKYIFHLSSLWAEDSDFINFSRANFIRAAKSIEEIKFEGGLIDVGYDFSFMGDISDVMYESGKIKLLDYISKTKQSFVVFNGPSVKRCHGWKIAEYLSMGKAIISTKLHNDLPVSLEHGKNIYFVDDNYQSFKEAIEFLLNNPQQVDKLQEGAYKYWIDHLLPETVITRIVNFTVKKQIIHE